MPSTSTPYAYTPSLILGIIGVGLFCLIAIGHAVLIFRFRSWDGIYMLIGALGKNSPSYPFISLVFLASQLTNHQPTVQAMGLGARVYSSEDQDSFGAYGAQYVLLFMGPTLVMFTVNITQVKFMHCLKSDKLGIIPARFRFPIYLTPNIAFLLIQVVGAVILVITHKTSLSNTATDILKGSYGGQLIFWLFTMVENLVWSIRFKRSPAGKDNTLIPHWTRYNQLFGLAIAIIALGRNLMRLTELSMASNSFLVVNEWPSYAFDYYQTGVVLIMWDIFYLPGFCRGLAITNMLHAAKHVQNDVDGHGRIGVSDV